MFLVALSVALPFLLLAIQGELTPALDLGVVRQIVLPTAIVVYIIGVTPLIWRSEESMAESLRPVVNLDSKAYTDLVVRSGRRTTRAGWLAFAAGSLFGLWLNDPAAVVAQRSAFHWYLLVSYMVMFGAMGWIVYSAWMSTRLTAKLHRESLEVDIFDISPFEPVGRQGLTLALLFVGGTLISLIFVFSWVDIFRWQNLIIYSTLLAVSLLLFFFAMWPTHSALTQVKKRRLYASRQNIARAYYRLEKETNAGNDVQSVAFEIEAWMTMEQRLKLTRTWPYNTEMLRTLFISILTPLFLAGARVVTTLLAEQWPPSGR